MAPDTPAPAAPTDVPEPPAPSPARGSAAWLKRFLLVSLALLSAAVVGLGLAYYRWEASRIQTQKYEEIAAIAATKVALITRWTREQMSDARRIAESPSVRAELESQTFSPGHEAERAALLGRLRRERDTNGYADVLLLSPAGELLLSARGDPGPPDPPVLATETLALQSTGPVLGELRRTHAGAIRLDIMASIRDAAGHSLAVIALSSDANDFLFPTIQAWPTPSTTAETLIVRRDGQDVLFLNELRHRRGTALSLRERISRDDLPAAGAIQGQTGRFLGNDYRGQRVLADLRAVPGTPWFMIAKIDTSEILTEVRYRAAVTVAGVVAAILLMAAGAAYAYRARQSSERAEAQAVIRRSEALLRESQRVASLGHYSLDVESGAWERSETLNDVLGIGPGYRRDVGGWIGLVHPDDRDDLTAYLSTHVLKERRTFDKEYRIVRAGDGEVRWVHGLGHLKMDGGGRPVEMFGTIQDVTARRLADEMLRERNAELARFVYTVSHDLKSPLVTIRTFLGFLDEDRRRDDAARVDKDLDFIRRAADKMASLLDDLVELSRVGRTMNPPETVPLQVLVRDAVEMVAGRIARGRVQVVVTEAPVVLRGDRLRLLEIFENLLDNAVKFMGDQIDPRVEIDVEESARQIVIVVRDNGTGIDPRHISRLFGLFEKLQPESEGTGIGLALVKRIVEVHGGRVWVESAGIGHGAVFRFTLPGASRP